MVKGFDELVREVVNRARAIERLVLSNIDILGPKAIDHINMVDLEGLRRYIKKKYERQQDYFKLTVLELRRLARRRKIEDYQSMDKITLVIKLEIDDDTKEIGIRPEGQVRDERDAAAGEENEETG